VSNAAKNIHSTLEVCKPSLTHLFGNDEDRIEKALDAAKYKPYQAAPYRSKASSSSFYCPFCSQEGRDYKKKSYQKPYSKKRNNNNRSSEKGNGPASKKREGQKKK
jgi:argininosuccinate synthase